MPPVGALHQNYQRQKSQAPWQEKSAVENSIQGKNPPAPTTDNQTGGVQHKAEAQERAAKTIAL